MPGRSWPSRLVLAVAAAVAGDAAADRRRHRHARRHRHRQLPGDPGRARGLRRRTGRRARQRRPAAPAADRQPRPPAAAGGLPLGQACRRGRSRSPGPAPSWPSCDAVEFVVRAGDLPQRGGDPDRPPAEPAGGHGAARAAARIRCSRSPPQYGITSAPSLGNPDFLAAVVFDLPQRRGHARRRGSPTSSRTAARPRSSCACGPT